MFSQISGRRQIIAVVVLLGVLGAVAALVTTSGFNKDRYAEQRALKQPRLVGSQPGAGEELAPDGGITLTFDQPMNRASVERAIHLDPPVRFAVHWDNDRKVVIQLEAGSLKPASHLTISLDASAAGANGWEILEARRITLDTAGYLRVSDISPTDKTKDADQNTSIRVMFNHPVVNLTLAQFANQGINESPLTITPPVEGTGTWVNTSIYEWYPTGSLHSGETYVATVNPELKDTSGTGLSKLYRTSFTVVGPKVVSVSPDSSRSANSDYYYDLTPTNFPLGTAIDVTFNIPMDRASTEGAFTVVSTSTGIPVHGNFSWNDESMHLTFRPHNLLDMEQEYEVTVGAGARSADGFGELKSPRVFHFKTVERPKIESGSWRNGGDGISPYFSDGVGFNTLMDEDSLTEPGRVTISPPPLEPIKLSASTYSTRSWLYFDTRLRGNTKYTVTINPGAKDIYGNVIEEPYTMSFTTRAYYPRVQINTGSRYGVYDASQPTRIVLATRAISEIDFVLYKLSVDEFAQARYRYDEIKPGKESLIRKWSETFIPLEDDAQITPVAVAPDGGALAPGIYLLKATFSGARYDNSREHILFVTNANLTYKVSPGQAMVWLTDLHSAQPLSDVPVTIYAADPAAGENGVAKVSTKTSSDGTATVSVPVRLDQDTYMYDYYSAYSYAIADDGKTFAAGLTAWDEGISISDFGVDPAYSHSEQTLYLYTDRPIYRPGQDVYFRGILRDRNDMVFSLPEADSVSVVIEHMINGYDRKSVSRATYPVDEMGAFHGSFTLPDKADLGRYIVTVDTGGKRYEQQDCAYYWYCGTTSDAYFDVAEYRKPEFDVRLTTDAPDILAGDTASVTLDARFFSGGPVSNAKVKWQVKNYDSAFTYSGPGRYRFTDYRQYWGYFYYDDYDYSYGLLEEEEFVPVIASGEGVTDKNGRLVIPFTTPAGGFGTQELRVEAEVSDIGGVPVSGKTSIMSHDSQYHVGISSDAYWGEVGSTQTMNLIVVDWAGNPVSGQTVGVQLSRQSYVRERRYSEYGYLSWEWTTQDSPVGDALTAVTDDKGQASIAVTLPDSGSFRIRATVSDPRGKSQSSSAFIWASSYSYTLLRTSRTDDQTDIVADRPSYQPGQTASILINNPFQGEVRALVTVERENVLSHEVITLNGGSTSYTIPITPELAPDVYVSVTLLKGIDATSPTPDFKMGLTRLKVLPTAQTLKITVTPEDGKVEPGTDAKFHVQVTDLSGQPAAAQVSLALVDAAVLKLAKPNSINILDHFYRERRLGVWTSQPMTALVDRLFVEVIPDNEEGGRGGGGGGPGLKVPDPVRENFKDTAYWNATIQTDAQGQAVVTVPLPDNLTIWRLDVRAVTPDTHVGQGEAEIQTTLPLLIRPETPRFFIAGDQATLSAIVNNNTDSDITAVVSLESQGLTLEGDARQTVIIPAQNRQIVQWPVRVNEGIEWVDVVFRAEGGGYSDAARPEIGDAEHNRNLPVFRYTVYEPVATAGQLTYGSQRTEYVSLPPGLDPAQGGVSVQIQHSLAATTLDGLTWLKHYPYECNEQFTSRLLPNSITLAAMKDLGVSDPALEAELIEQRDTGVATLLERQTTSGGWGLWPEDEGDALVTAYVLHGLIEAKKAGADIPAPKARRAVTYLSRWLDGTPDKVRGGINRAAYVVYVLSRANELNRSDNSVFSDMPEVKSLDKRIGELYDDRSKLNLYAKALLAQAIGNKNPFDLRLGTLRSELTDAAVVSATMVHWEETNHDYWNWDTDIRTTAIVLDTYTKLWPDSELGPGATRWLVAMRQSDHWSTTQETAWSLLALSDWMRVTHELNGDYPWSLTVGDRQLASGNADSASLLKTTTVNIDLEEFLTNDNFTIERGEGPGRLYYTGQMVTYPDVESVTQVNRGVSISRRYLDSEGKQVTQARVGDTLTVEVTIVAPSNLYYPIIEDYYPAGADPIDPELLSQPLSTKKAALESQDANRWRWGWSRFSHVQMRDEKAVLSTDFLPSGTYQLRYQVRITMPGLYHVIPPTIWQFYVPDVYGRGDGFIFEVLPAS